jgi:hypothetical protein
MPVPCRSSFPLAGAFACEAGPPRGGHVPLGNSSFWVVAGHFYLGLTRTYLFGSDNARGGA